MSKFNKSTTRSATFGVMGGVQSPSGKTHGGAPGYERNLRSELFIFGIQNMVSENTFYENADDRDERFRHLVREVTVVDPDWCAHFLRWLRSEGNMRSAAVVGAAEYAWARRDEAGTGRTGTTHPRPSFTTRQVIESVLQRLDEPGELLAYWTSKYGRNVPMPVKRGIADAMTRLCTQYAALKYDSGNDGWRLGDVIELTHPRSVAQVRVSAECPTPTKIKYATMSAAPATTKKNERSLRAYLCKCGWWHTTKSMTPYRHEVEAPVNVQGDLYEYLIDRRHNRDNEIPASLTMVRNNRDLRRAFQNNEISAKNLTAEMVRAAGLTWEDLLSLAGSRVTKKTLWEVVIPSMGYMALLRNLRNFDEAGISDTLAEKIGRQLADPGQVARSRQFPYRFFSAFRAAPNLRWAYPLEKALQTSVANVPVLSGRTLVMVDTSASMRGGISDRSKMTHVEVAALFGATLAVRNPGNVDLYGFADGVFKHHVPAGSSILTVVDQFRNRIGEVGHGTRAVEGTKTAFNNHDRVIVISDEQIFGGWYGANVETMNKVVPANVPLYTFNLVGYQSGMVPLGDNRYQLGGLTDATFTMLSHIEANKNAVWPWDNV